MKRFTTLFTIIVLAAFLAVPNQASAGERHPELRAAIHALEVAKHRLERAEHDFGGHRKEALEQCDRAIEQLKLAIQFDR